MGFIVLGIAGMSVQGLTGATYQSIAHGLTTGALFMAIGVLYERRHTRSISDFGGLAKVMPWFTAAFMIAMLGSAGLPGLVGFVGEFLILVGTFTDGHHTLMEVPALLLVATSGVVLGAVYLLHLFQRLMFGPITNKKNESLPDLGIHEKLAFLPVIGLIIFMGVYPKPFIDRIDPTAQNAVETFHHKRCVALESAGKDTHLLGEYPEFEQACEQPFEVVEMYYGRQTAIMRMSPEREESE
jgi:NADH-quinone oxidoreductase subunit M